MKNNTVFNKFCSLYFKEDILIGFFFIMIIVSIFQFMCDTTYYNKLCETGEVIEYSETNNNIF